MKQYFLWLLIAMVMVAVSTATSVQAFETGEVLWFLAALAMIIPSFSAGVCLFKAIVGKETGVGDFILLCKGRIGPLIDCLPKPKPKNPSTEVKREEGETEC